MKWSLIYVGTKSTTVSLAEVETDKDTIGAAAVQPAPKNLTDLIEKLIKRVEKLESSRASTGPPKAAWKEATGNRTRGTAGRTSFHRDEVSAAKR